MNIKQLHGYLNEKDYSLSIPTIRNYVLNYRHGQRGNLAIPNKKVGGRLRFEKEEVDNWLKEMGVRV